MRYTLFCYSYPQVVLPVCKLVGYQHTTSESSWNTLMDSLTTMDLSSWVTYIGKYPALWNSLQAILCMHFLSGDQMRPNHWLKLAMVDGAHLVLFVVALYLLQLLGILSKSRHHASPQGFSQLNTAGHSSKPGSQRETITTGRYHNQLLVTPTLHFTPLHSHQGIMVVI